jgi:hypothetical protein
MEAGNPRNHRTMDGCIDVVSRTSIYVYGTCMCGKKYNK